jgi:hypothetical protein
MLQTIVYEDPIPTRLLLNHHSTRTAVPAWRCDSPRLAFSEASTGGWESWCVSAIQQLNPSPELRAEAQEEEATASPPVALATCRASEGKEAMAKTRQRRVDSFSRRLRSGPGMWWESQPGRSALATHEVHSACVHTGDPDEFKPEYMSQALAG